MIPATFDYVRPATLAEAIGLLLEHDGEAVLMSGGQSLVPMLKLRLAQPGIVVDLAGIEGLDGIEVKESELRIGAMARHRVLADHAGIRSRLPMLTELAGGIGDAQVRDWGTIGGSLAHNDPAADWPAGLMASRATVVCQGGNGEREIDARDLGLGAYTTALELGEVITHIRVPLPAARSGSAYVKVPRAGGDFAVAGAAVVLELDADGRVETAGIGLTAVSEMPFAATDAEAALVGQALDDALLERCATVAAGQTEPGAGIHGSEDYQRAVAREVTLRALRLASERATDDGSVEGSKPR